MTKSDFISSINDPSPQAGLDPLLKSLWYDAKGDWHRAHEIIQDITGKAASWIHAYLHRKEGDLINAKYWYMKAQKTCLKLNLILKRVEQHPRLAGGITLNTRPFIREIKETDYPSVKRIYEEGIASGNATFEKTAPGWEEWNSRKLPYCRLAAIDGDEVAGWAALSETSDRKVYKGICEVSIYVSPALSGKGIGKLLMNALIEESEKRRMDFIRIHFS